MTGHGAAAGPLEPAARRSRVLESYRAYFDAATDPGAGAEERVLALVRDAAATVPAYREFLAEHGVDPASIRSRADLRRLPLTDKDGYVRRYPLPQRCRHGRLAAADMLAVSSGSSGAPTVWPRSVNDELAATARFEQVFRDGFQAHRRRTLAVVCFPLGTWVGGMFSAACTRHLAAKGHPVTVVTPGNNTAEILRVVPELAPHVDQVVLLGYPPFVKEVVDAGRAAGVGWAGMDLKLLLAGEVFSEQWRTLVAERGGVADPVSGIAALYGTADAGVLANETALSVRIRRFLAGRPDLARELFGSSRLPSLLQYDPAGRYFEQRDGTLLFTADGVVPLIRYHIADEGGIISHAEMLAFCSRHGVDPGDGPRAPFVYVFGRSLFTVSLYGANVYPENVTTALESPELSGQVTGRFVLEAPEDADRDRYLRLTVELAAGPDAARPDLAVAIATAVQAELRRTNSEFAHYVPAHRQLPDVHLRPAGDPEYFPTGVKHRYTRAPRALDRTEPR